MLLQIRLNCHKNYVCQYYKTVASCCPQVAESHLCVEPEHL